MDAQAYLIKHGWSGPGNPLNPNQRPGAHGGLGLTRPILVSRKANNHGVGKKTTKDPTNQWWLRGFEDALKGIGNDSFEATSARESNALTSELYRHFVRGEGLAGTLDGYKKEAMVSTSAAMDTTSSKSKRKREDGEDKSDRKARRLEKAKRKEEKAIRKEERRVKRVAKVERREKKIAEKEAKKARKEAKRTASEEDYPTPTSIGQESAETTETDEAATCSREKTAKKEKKESKKAKSAESEVGVEDSKKKSKKEKKDKKAKA
ncbi:hypothetical protein N7535_000309 [Penicillium sp. DV-2018c]|nr:hypothetical protein N7461_006446 [Penicillium sp. DV-2018c]KAJ5581689.1 hypothetical protein N7535_000309 [Penicillium sp. DV-2018c]